MQKISYQPTGVYKQFTTNPGMLNKQTTNPSPQADNDIKPVNKVAKVAKIGLFLAAAAGVYSFGKYYKQGMDAIKLKSKVLGDISSESDFSAFIEGQAFSEAEVRNFRKIKADYEKYSKNIVGKIHKKLTDITQFFKNNFYNY